MAGNAETEKPEDAALNLMREWWWPHDQSRGFPGKMELREAVNRLAMDGQPRPQAAILTLLCSGDLAAQGDQNWRKYQWNEEFQFSENEARISEKRWQILREIMDDERQKLIDDEWPLPFVKLAKLGIPECPIYEWDFNQNRFSTASFRLEKSTYDPEYLEESYSAQCVYIWPKFIAKEHNANSENIEVSRAIETQVHRGGRPPIADWEAAALEMAGRYYRGDLKPGTIADVSRELASWLAERDIHPSDSTLRPHAKSIFDAFQVWEQE